MNKGSPTQRLGHWYERVASRFLKQAGLRLLETNYHCRFGEIDLIFLDKNTVVFVEVRFRGRQTHGSAVESVTLRKQRKIIRAAVHYLRHGRFHVNPALRFDVVGISPVEGKLRCRWIRNAFSMG